MNRQHKGEEATPVRVGLLLTDRRVPEWIYRLVAGLVESPQLELVLAVDEVPTDRPSLPRRLLEQRRHLMYRLYSRLDHYLFLDRPDAFRPRSLDALLEGVPGLRVEPLRSRFSDRYREEDLERIREHRLDVALRFGKRILRGGVLRVARHGVWSYHHGDNRVNRGGPPGFWEVLEGWPTTGVTLQVLEEELDGGRVLARGVHSTYPLSVRRNRNRVYLKGIPLAQRALEELAQDGQLPEADSDDPPTPYDRPLYRKPANGVTVRLLAGLMRRGVAQKVRDRIHPKRWFLAYAFGAGEVPPPLHRFRELHAPRGRSWADPFPVRSDDGLYLFHEEYRHPEGRGVIVARRATGDGGWEDPETVLERPYHLSYPFVFPYRGEWYMMPETGANRTVELYRARRFPGDWDRDRVLLKDLRAVDATLVEVEGTWWMFVNVASPDAHDAHDELHLFWAPEPFGPWAPHRRNPVKVDCRSARSAGRPFWSGGALHRPAQDGSRRYGWAVSFQRVDRLDRDGFVETEVGRIEPRWRPGLLATHTYNRTGDLVVVDAMGRRRGRRP